MTENIHKIVSACITITGCGKRWYKKKKITTCQEITKLTENLRKSTFCLPKWFKAFSQVNVINPVPFFNTFTLQR